MSFETDEKNSLRHLERAVQDEKTIGTTSVVGAAKSFGGLRARTPANRVRQSISG